jgi:hypothetical protein
MQYLYPFTHRVPSEMRFPDMVKTCRTFYQGVHNPIKHPDLAVPMPTTPQEVLLPI